MGIKITDDQRGMAKLLANCTALARCEVTVGFHADKATRREGDATNAAVAASHEFGTSDIPRRPFLAPALDEGAKKLGDLQAAVVGKVLDDVMEVEQAAGLVGELAVALVKAKITSNVPPPLAEGTAQAKGSSNSLINTGQMRAAVSFGVHLGGAPPDGR